MSDESDSLPTNPSMTGPIILVVVIQDELDHPIAAKRFWDEDLGRAFAYYREQLLLHPRTIIAVLAAGPAAAYLEVG